MPHVFNLALDPFYDVYMKFACIIRQQYVLYITHTACGVCYFTKILAICVKKTLKFRGVFLLFFVEIL